jgi:hypothetical protein
VYGVPLILKQLPSPCLRSRGIFMGPKRIHRCAGLWRPTANQRTAWLGKFWHFKHISRPSRHSDDSRNLACEAFQAGRRPHQIADMCTLALSVLALDSRKNPFGIEAEAANLNALNRRLFGATLRPEQGPRQSKG